MQYFVLLAHLIYVVRESPFLSVLLVIIDALKTLKERMTSHKGFYIKATKSKVHSETHK